MANSPNRDGKTSRTGYWLESPVRRSTNAVASEYMERRWGKSRATQWDYQMTRRTVLEELRPQPGERILEIGCGPGTWTREIAPLCQEVVAVDISEAMLAEAQKYTQGLPVRFVHSDFIAAPLDGAWDKIFSARAIEYIADRQDLARKIAGLLAPGGTVVLITKARFSLWRGRMRLLYRAAPWPRLARRRLGQERNQDDRARVRQYLSSPGDLAAAFAPYGLVPTRIRPVVLRPPLFRRGFHEIPLIPESLATPFLALSGRVYQASSHLPQQLAWLPLLLSESYCITLQHTARLSKEAGQATPGRSNPARLHGPG